MHCVTLLQKLTHIRQYIALLFYIILLSDHQCVAGNIITNSTVYCVMNVWSCFVMVLKLYVLVPLRIAVRGEVWLWHGGWLPYRCCAT
jgi:VanZ family protein